MTLLSIHPRLLVHPTTIMETYKEHVVLASFEGHEKGKGKRRASFEVRRSNIFKHNAVAVRLIAPVMYLMMPGTWQQDLDNVPFDVPPLKDRAMTLAEFDKMQRKLYRVTKDGCMIPHESWAMRQQGNIDKGYQLMMDAFYGWRPAGGGQHVVEVQNQFGWSKVLQASHLCHMGPMCCNPTHVIAEPRWRNLKRNYCGSAGVCDCCQGLNPPWNSFPCLNVYRSWSLSDIPEDNFVVDPEEIRDVLDVFNCPGFFEPAGELRAGMASPAGHFVENVHWEFIADDQIAAFADADAQKAAKLAAKRARR